MFVKKWNIYLNLVFWCKNLVCSSLDIYVYMMWIFYCSYICIINYKEDCIVWFLIWMKNIVDVVWKCGMIKYWFLFLIL